MMTGDFVKGRGFPEIEARRGMSAESLIKILGREAAEQVMFYWGGTRVSVPDLEDLDRIRLRERVSEAFRNGATPAQVSERFGISVRTAQRMRRRPNCIERKSEMI